MIGFKCLSLSNNKSKVMSSEIKTTGCKYDRNGKQESGEIDVNNYAGKEGRQRVQISLPYLNTDGVVNLSNSQVKKLIKNLQNHVK